MARLLIVHHTPSPAVHALFGAVKAGATAPEITGVEVVTRAALAVGATDVLEADGIIIGSPVNLGYLSGAVKHFFDQIYYPCLEETIGLPFAAYLHGNDDATGALRALTTITTGLRWRLAQEPLALVGPPSQADLDACWELGASLAAQLSLDS